MKKPKIDPFKNPRFAKRFEVELARLSQESRPLIKAIEHSERLGAEDLEIRITV